MRKVNKIILNGIDAGNVNGDVIDANQLLSASFQIYFGDSNANGTVNIQASNDEYNAQYVENFTPTHWSNIPNAQALISGGNDPILTIANMAYRWIRATWTNTGTGVQTIMPLADNTPEPNISDVTAVADTGALEQSDITAVADTAGSLQSTYFTFSNALNAINYYAWYNVSGGGTDPAIGGKTGIEVDISTGDSANTVATATRAAIAAAAPSSFTLSGATSHIIITNKLMGNSTNSADGGVPTGFSFSTVTNGAASNLNSKDFLFSSANNGVNYYVWYNVNSQGVDPALAGKTGIQVAIAAGAPINTVASSSRSAITAAASANVTISGATSHIIITNNANGACTATADGTAATGFSFSTTQIGHNGSNMLGGEYFFINAGNNGTAYYVWFKVSGVGTDPAVAGKTGIEVDIATDDTAATVGAAIASALNAVGGGSKFTASGTTTVTVTNVAAGPFVPAADFNTGFAFAITGGGSSNVVVNMFALGM